MIGQELLLLTVTLFFRLLIQAVSLAVLILDRLAFFLIGSSVFWSILFCKGEITLELESHKLGAKFGTIFIENVLEGIRR